MKTRKWMPFLLSALFMLGGCHLTPPPISSTPAEVYYDATKYSAEFKNRLQYQQLSSSEQQSYGQIYTALMDGIDTDTIIEDHSGQQHPGIRIPLLDTYHTKEEMSQIFEALFRDNPQFFYLDRTYSLEGQEINGETVYETFILQYTMNTAQRKVARQELEQTVNTILQNCPTSTDEYLVELYLHDQVTELCSYDIEAAAGNADEYANAYTAHGALVDGAAVCEGYARALQLLFDRVNIASTVIMGCSLEDNEAHMWNMVRINGAYYHLDATWNDNEDRQQYAYFNITTDQIERTHLLDSDQLVTEICTESKDNYYVRSGTQIDTYERDQIAEIIAKFVDQGHTAIHLRFADNKYENGLLFLKNAALAHNKINSHFQNEESMWEYTLFTLSKQKVITLYKRTD